MNWVREAESKLRDYSAKAQSLKSATERIAQLELEMSCVRSATTDGTAVHGGGNGLVPVIPAQFFTRFQFQHVGVNVQPPGRDIVFQLHTALPG